MDWPSTPEDQKGGGLIVPSLDITSAQFAEFDGIQGVDLDGTLQMHLCREGHRYALPLIFLY